MKLSPERNSWHHISRGALALLLATQLTLETARTAKAEESRYPFAYASIQLMHSRDEYDRGIASVQNEDNPPAEVLIRPSESQTAISVYEGKTTFHTESEDGGTFRYDQKINFPTDRLLRVGVDGTTVTTVAKDDDELSSITSEQQTQLAKSSNTTLTSMTISAKREGFVTSITTAHHYQSEKITITQVDSTTTKTQATFSPIDLPITYHGKLDSGLAFSQAQIEGDLLNEIYLPLGKMITADLKNQEVVIKVHTINFEDNSIAGEITSLESGKQYKFHATNTNDTPYTEIMSLEEKEQETNDNQQTTLFLPTISTTAVE